MEVPLIRRLELTRFRAFESLTWRPGVGSNLILGGGDVGKSTILDAIALLLYPTNGFVLSDADYYRRSVVSEFSIEAVMTLPESTGINDQAWTAWPWEWDSEQGSAVLPSVGSEVQDQEPVYCLRVRGTPELDLIWELVQPDQSVLSFSAALRRRIGSVRLAGDDRADRDLRLVQGGGLDRLLDDRGLRAKLGAHLAQDGLEEHLSDEARARLTQLDANYSNRRLPHDLGLGFVGGPGVSINALVGLTASPSGVVLPMTSWGSGTRRLSALAIADALKEGAPITLIDEIERGLEPYRQASLMQSLTGQAFQSFITTHSAFAIQAATEATLWYVDSAGRIGELPQRKVGALQRNDPAALLSRLTVVAEGSTEKGFLEIVLSQQLHPDWRAHGLHVTNVMGNDAALDLLEGLHSGGVLFAGMADREVGNPHPDRWRILELALGPRLVRWPTGNLESNVFPVFGSGRIRALLEDPNHRRTGQRVRTLVDRLGLPRETTWDQLVAAAGDRLMQVALDAALGVVPQGVEDREQRQILKGHASQWFKSEEGGREIARKLFDLNLWSAIEPRFAPLLSELRAAIHD